MKAIVGILTNSLGILSEALHSGLDLVAAVTTVYAVKASNKPPDEEYHYGHGKYESLSALVEVMILIATCAWITLEAFQRLFFQGAHVDVSLAGFVVMFISIVLDVSRSRVLYRVAKKYQSQALEADALHFSSDVLSSAVVIVGLFLVTRGYLIADSLAALGVVVVIVSLSMRLGKRTVWILLDRAPEGFTEKIRAEVSKISDVWVCKRIRLRRSGAQTFVDLEVYIEHSATFEKVNSIVGEIEQSIRKIIPQVDIVVRTHPAPNQRTGLADDIRSVAAKISGIRGLHNIEVHNANDGLHVELHLEMAPDISLKSAHEIASRFEATVKASGHHITEIVTHIESAGETPLTSADVTPDSVQTVSVVRAIALQMPKVKSCRGIMVHETENGVNLTLTCALEQNLSVAEAHEVATQIETMLGSKIEGISRVLVHTEPCLGTGTE